jgi:hypothetical protein
MATERLPMRHIRLLRLKWRLGRSHRETARSLGISAGVVASVLSRASKLGLTWDALEELTDDALEQPVEVGSSGWTPTSACNQIPIGGEQLSGTRVACDPQPTLHEVHGIKLYCSGVAVGLARHLAENPVVSADVNEDDGWTQLRL